jgi:hypothetical protein
VVLRITVWQLRHSKVSKSARSSRDLLACMAMPQTGQWRTRGLVVNFLSVKQGRRGGTYPNTDTLELI